MSLPGTADFLIIGGGIIGLAIARTLRHRFPDQSIHILEKEPEISRHASGRNSGVLHAGFYYTADSLKARLCRDGNRQWTGYCLEHDLPINQCGKVVVAKNAGELGTLDELFRRGEKNGVRLEWLDEQQLAEIEPLARTTDRALFSPATSSIDPLRVNEYLLKELQGQGVQITFKTRFVSRQSGNNIRSSQGNIEAGYVFNAAGLYADRVARDFGFSEHYVIVPFKGLYLHAGQELKLRTSIYPVPDLQNPFLGVHYTVTADGRCKIGPTAIPAFWREHYGGLDNFSIAECIEVMIREAGLLHSNPFNFRQLALQELRKYYKPHLIRLASELVQKIEPKNFTHWGRTGIRAQLLDTRNSTLEMDFCLEGDDKSLHVLNAVSPAYTCAFPFAEYIVDQFMEKTAT
ncbi:MAG: L-2-hydroxyglutarate oxidase [Thiotrichales bacterium]|nr:L-2-hydroxyglutarate oxidase [Thiotrichales bacterium]